MEVGYDELVALCEEHGKRDMLSLLSRWLEISTGISTAA